MSPYVCDCTNVVYMFCVYCIYYYVNKFEARSSFSTSHLNISKGGYHLLIVLIIYINTIMINRCSSSRYSPASHLFSDVNLSHLANFYVISLLLLNNCKLIKVTIIQLFQTTNFWYQFNL